MNKFDKIYKKVYLSLEANEDPTNIADIEKLPEPQEVGNEESALPNEDSVKMTPEKQVQLVKLAIQALFVDKNSFENDPSIQGLISSLSNPTDLTNVERKEKDLVQLLSSLNLPKE
jgi:hypothetical protein